MAGLRGLPSRQQRGRHGRRTDVRERHRGPRRQQRRRHDGRLGANPLRRLGKDFLEDHQRSPRDQPGGLRHLVQAAGDY